MQCGSVIWTEIIWKRSAVHIKILQIFSQRNKLNKTLRRCNLCLSLVTLAVSDKTTCGHILEAVKDIHKDEYDDSANEWACLLGHPAPEEPSPSVGVSHHGGDRHFSVGKEADHKNSCSDLKWKKSCILNCFNYNILCKRYYNFNRRAEKCTISYGKITSFCGHLLVVISESIFSCKDQSPF